MKNCKKCGFDNEDEGKYCSNCGSALEEKEVPVQPDTSDVVATQSPQNTTKKKILLVILALVLFISIPLIVVNCLAGSGSTTKNVKKYVYHGNGIGDGSYFLVDYDNETYKYVGTDVYSAGIFCGGTLEVEGFISYQKTRDGYKCYFFHDNPWDRCSNYIAIDEKNGQLFAFNKISYYIFQEE